MSLLFEVFNASPRMGQRPCGAFLLCCGTICSIGLGQSATFQVVEAVSPIPSAPFMSIADVANDGTVLGQFTSGASEWWGFTWSSTQGQHDLQAFDENGITIALGITADGQTVVGGAERLGAVVPVMWQAGAAPIQLFAVPSGYFFGYVIDVSPDGDAMCGELSDQAPLSSYGTGWVAKTSSPPQLIGGLPGGNLRSSPNAIAPGAKVSYGSALSTLGAEAITWTPALGIKSLGDLPGGPVDALLIATGWSGSVAAGWGNQGKRHAVRWTEAHGMVDLGTHVGPSGSSQAWGIAGDGWTVVGRSAEPFVGNRGMIWNPIDGLRLLQGVLEDEYGLDLGEWTITQVDAISDDGTFLAGRVGSATTSTGFLVEMPPFCYADCDRGSGKGVLDVFDFLCYMSHFDQQDIYSNCNNDGAVDFFDFLCFINKWQEGCP